MTLKLSSLLNQVNVSDRIDNLNNIQKEYILNQINDFEINYLSKIKDNTKPKGKIKPLKALNVNEIKSKSQEFEALGIQAIKEKKVAAVLLAGGQGTRLGFNHPKGMLNIGINKKVYIFEILIRNLIRVVKKVNCWIPLYIMTSETNNYETITFFKEHDYFGYNSEYIFFFKQNVIPSIDFDGNILFETKENLALSPCGNGCWFKSLYESDSYFSIENSDIEWFNVFAVDNVLQKIADPVFIGATLASNASCGAKVVSKTNAMEKVGVLCTVDNKPAIVEYFEMTDEMINSKNKDCELEYRYGVILNYLFKKDKLIDVINQGLPIHIAEKKIPYLDENEKFIVPSEPNGYKFETLVTDMVHMMDECLPYEVERNKEFAPIKNMSGVDSVESARKLLLENQIEL